MEEAKETILIVYCEPGKTAEVAEIGTEMISIKAERLQLTDIALSAFQ